MVIEERSSRANDVRAEVGRLWGPNQRIIGPFLVVPYTVKLIETDDGKRVEHIVERHAIFTPETLDVSGHADAKTLHRSIYDVPVYAAQLKFSGRFGAVRIGDVEPEGVETVRWSEALFVLSLSGVSRPQVQRDAADRRDDRQSRSRPASASPPNNLEGVHARLAAARRHGPTIRRSPSHSPSISISTARSP